MTEPISHRHHYVPRWYQKQFLAIGQQKLWYLDLKPEKITINGRDSFTRQALRSMYPAQCFCFDDLYLLRFGKHVTDVIEKSFFGTVDRRGHLAAQFFEAFAVGAKGLNDSYRGLLGYIAAQRFRTPRGLDWIKRQSGVPDQNRTLMVMRQLFEAYNAMWMEGVWEIVHARNSATKFIISDNPVTFFNRKIYPGEAQYPGGDDFPKIGTRTIFPLSAEHCLVITHLQLVRNPWCKPLGTRENARLFGQTAARLTAIQHGRALEENEVLRVNYILKHAATKFIASGRKDDLYPESTLGRIDWAKLDDDWFLLPHLWKVSFTTGIRMGTMDGRHLAIDEYGRDPRHAKYEDPHRRAEDHRTFEEGKREWAKKRVGKSLAQSWERGREDSVHDMMMREYQQEEGLLPREEPVAEK
jgi:hypothetical protein